MKPEIVETKTVWKMVQIRNGYDFEEKYLKSSGKIYLFVVCLLSPVIWDEA